MPAHKLGVGMEEDFGDSSLIPKHGGIVGDIDGDIPHQERIHHFDDWERAGRGHRLSSLFQFSSRLDVHTSQFGGGDAFSIGGNGSDC